MGKMICEGVEIMPNRAAASGSLALKKKVSLTLCPSKWRSSTRKGRTVLLEKEGGALRKKIHLIHFQA